MGRAAAGTGEGVVGIPAPGHSRGEKGPQRRERGECFARLYVVLRVTGSLS